MADYHVRRSRLSSSGSGSDDFEDESLDPRIQVGIFLFNVLFLYNIKLKSEVTPTIIWKLEGELCLCVTVNCSIAINF